MVLCNKQYLASGTASSKSLLQKWFDKTVSNSFDKASLSAHVTGFHVAMRMARVWATSLPVCPQQQRGQAPQVAPEPEPMEEDDLGVELEDEYNPLKPNNYEECLLKRRAEEATAKVDEKRVKTSSSEKKSLTALSNYSDSDSEDEEEKRKEERRKG